MEELVGFRIVDKCNYITIGNDTLQFPLEYDWYTPVYKIVHDTIGVPMDKTQGEILRLLNDIYIDGVGYNDVVGVVAVPLIIALFAFSFPFVFDRINQINDKYQSKILSTLFSSFLLYKLYWFVSLISIVYVLVYGACTLFCKDNVLGDYAVIWNGIINERNKVESKSFESWRYLAVFHYAALAYGFGRGKYALLNIHLL